MGNTIYPCFWFDNNAAEAAAFYQGIFDRAEIADQNPFVVLMHVNDQRVMLLNGGPKFKINPSLSLFVNCTNAERVRTLMDGFGLSWQIVPENIGALMRDAERAQRVMQVLLPMKKIDKAILEEA